MSREVTSKQVRAVWAAMRKEHGCRLKPKSESRLMKTVSKVLNWMRKRNKKMMSGKAFMVSVWTTVRCAIYYPAGVVIGRGTQAELLDQIDKAVHECTHVLQKVGVKYLVSPARIAKIETDAFIASMEIHHWLTGQVPSPAETAEKLRAYGCNDAQIKYAKEKYRLASGMISRGHYRSETVKTAIRVLRQY